MYLGPYIKSTVTDPEFFLKQSDEEKGGGGVIIKEEFMFIQNMCV